MTPSPAEPAIVTIEPDVDRRFVVIRIDGTLTIELAIDAQQKVVREHAGMNRIWDFRGSDLTAWSMADMSRFIDGVLQRGGALPGTRLAAIVSRDVEFGLARMFGSLAEDRLDVRPAVFRDEASAIAWITATP